MKAEPLCIVERNGTRNWGEMPGGGAGWTDGPPYRYIRGIEDAAIWAAMAHATTGIDAKVVPYPGNYVAPEPRAEADYMEQRHGHRWREMNERYSR